MSNIDKAWSEFFNGGWSYGEVPNKRECFKAGYLAGAKFGMLYGEKYKEEVKEWYRKGLPDNVIDIDSIPGMVKETIPPSKWAQSISKEEKDE